MPTNSDLSVRTQRHCVDPADEPIQSVVRFTDPRASMTSQQADYQDIEKAKLYSQIGSLPEGSRKRRLAKQVYRKL